MKILSKWVSHAVPLKLLLLLSYRSSTSQARAFLVQPGISHVNKRVKMAGIHRRRPTLDNPISFNIARGGGISNKNTSRNKFELHTVPSSDISFVFNNAPFIQSSLIFTCANTLGLFLSIATNSQLHVDLLGTGAFALASLPALFNAVNPATSASSITRVTLSSTAVFVWATKLSLFLLYRIFKVKSDIRLEDGFKTVGGSTTFWFISLLWGLICSLPHTIGTTSMNPGNPLTVTIGSTIYILGLVTESLADYQKWQFKSTNPGQFCNEGLWSITQHPNFFGNLLLWSGIFIMNSDSLIDWNAISMSMSSASNGNGGGIMGFMSTAWTAIWSSRRAFIAILSPLFMWTLFKGQADGSITNTFELAMKKYGHDPKYQEYVKDVPFIVPNIFSWLKALLPGK